MIKTIKSETDAFGLGHAEFSVEKRGHVFRAVASQHISSSEWFAHVTVDCDGMNPEDALRGLGRHLQTLADALMRDAIVEQEA